MKKKLAVILLLIITILSYGAYWTFFDMNRLPKGELISEVTLPNGKYTIKSYVSSGGATTDFVVLGELNYNNAKKNSKNIYWNYREKNADIKWIDNENVNINGHQLNVLHDTFDFRRSK